VAIQAYRLLAARLEARAPGAPSYPFHVGVTEAGDAEDGRVKSAIGIGSLLEDGIGDTIRVSLTEDPVKEVPVAAALARHCQARWALPRAELCDPGAPFVDDPYAHRRRATRSVGEGPYAIGGEHPVRVELDLGPLPADPLGFVRALRASLARLPELACEGLLVEVLDPEAFGRLPVFERALAEAGLEAPLAVRGEPRFLADCGGVFARAVVTVGALIGDDELMDAARAAKERGFPLEWELRGRTSEIAGLLDRALAASVGVALGNLLFSVDAELPVHAVRILAARLRARGAADMPIVLRHRRDPTRSPEQSLIAAAVDLGAPLCDGIGDAVALAGWEDPSVALDLGYRILQGTRLRTTRTEFISCPSCGRTLFDLEETTARIKARTQHLSGVKIAIMGCIVNGPGEMADADFGYVGSGPGTVNLYVGKDLVERHLPQAQADDRLVALIREHGRWVDPA
jgi:(E)-4-hydroxy-3-methylbut-2-enyl-diphosphate synthase